MSIWYLSFTLFLLIDAIGNIPLYISLLKHVEPKRQRVIILREMIIAFCFIALFAFLGEAIMGFLQISQSTVQIAGGIVLFIICLKMIFPTQQDNRDSILPMEEPFIVPLAIPLIAGPAVLASIMIYAKQESNPFVLIGALFIGWFASLLILLCAPFLHNILGKRGLSAMEKLMGLIIILIAVQMFLSGIERFTHHNFAI